MSRKMSFAVLLVFFLAVPAVALADYNAGDYEMTLSGSGSSDNDLDNTVFSIEGSWGYFFSPVLEGVVRQGIGVVDTPGDNDWNGSTRVGLDYHFPFDRYIPYVGASVGFLYGDTVNEQIVLGPELGLKTFVNETTFVLAGVEYEFLTDDDDDFDDGRFVYTVGLGFKY